MKNLVFLGALVLFFASCGNVVFVSPQPEYIDALTEIPEKYHGIYEFEDSTIDSESYLVTDSSVGDMVLGDNLIVKQRGNYFYLNLFDENAYVVYVVKFIQALNYENIEMLFPNITDQNAYLFNILNIEEIKAYDDQDQFMFTSRPDYLIDKVSVNQMRVLLHQPISDDIVKLKRIK
jgi:hypothetical protein